MAALTRKFGPIAALFCRLTVRQARRSGRPLRVLLLYLGLAVAVLSPLAPAEVPDTGADDLGNHISGIIEARNALAEGQFPVRVAPHQNLGTRYPLFQFYGNLGYTLGGLLYWSTAIDPYVIWKTVIAAFLVLGAFFTYRSGRMLTRQPFPALACGAIFLTAPYMLTDVHGRVAFAETISFALLPVVFFYLQRCLVSRRAWPVMACGAAWSWLALAHGIAFVYGSLFFGLYVLSFAAPRKKAVGRVLRASLAYGLGLCLAAWYVAPQQSLVPHLCGGLLYPVMDQAWLTPLGVLLAPTVVPPVHLPTPYIANPQHFGLQVGWPILAAVGFALYTFRSGAAGRRALQARFLVLFFLAIFMVWSPVDFWSRLPKALLYVQFSYRLLMFVVLWGCLLAAFALATALDGKMRPIHLVFVLLLLGLCAAPQLAAHKTGTRVTVAKEIAEPNIGRGGANAVYNLSAQALLRTTLVHPDVDWAEPPYGILDDVGFHDAGVVKGAFPALQPGEVLVVEGGVPEEGRGPSTVRVAVNGQVLAAPKLPPGPFRLAVPDASSVAGDRAQVVVQADPWLEPPIAPPHKRPSKKPAFYVTRLAVERATNAPAGLQLMTARATRQATTYGHPTVVKLTAKQPSLVQLPVLFYPHQLRVHVDGKPVPPRNLGRFVAVEIPPGDHVIAVRFAGLRWANYLSLGAWCAVGVGILLITAERLRRIKGSNFEVVTPPG